MPADDELIGGFTNDSGLAIGIHLWLLSALSSYRRSKPVWVWPSSFGGHTSYGKNLTRNGGEAAGPRWQPPGLFRLNEHREGRGPPVFLLI
jgi:hypothetical protein